MFSADPDNPITWGTYITTILIAVCIYLIFRQRNDIALILGFTNSSSSDNTPSNQRIPILSTNDCHLLYSNTKKPSKRIDNLILSFTKQFVSQYPDFIIRAPASVNLLGENIDYNGYDALSMAVERDLLFAVKVIDTDKEENIIRICNNQHNELSAIKIDLSSKQDTDIDIKNNTHWSDYFKAAFNGVCANYCSSLNTKHFASLYIMIHGNIPKESALSSIAAFICSSIITLLYANLSCDDFNTITKSEIATLCIECERYIGIDSNGINEMNCMNANKGYCQYKSGFNIKLPSTSKVRWIISNALNKEGIDDFDTRLVECRLSALLLGKLLRLRQWRSVLTFRDIENITKMELDQLLFKCMDLLDNEKYSIEQIEDDLECKQLGIQLEDLMVGLNDGKVILDKLRENDKYRLPLQQRALHVYGEAMRVLRFADICVDNYESDEDENVDTDVNKDKVIKRLGKLMSDSHLSVRDKYEYSCDELDELQSLCIEGGALGARLMGNASNASVVSLVKAHYVNKFKSYLNKNYYASIPKVPLNHQFTATSAVGLTILKVV